MRVLHLAFWFAAGLLSVSTSLWAGTPGVKLKCTPAQGIATEAEMKPSHGGIYVINVTFIEKQPGDKEIDRVTRACLVAATKRDGTKDIVAFSWLRKNASANENDDTQLRPYGRGKMLIYRAAKKAAAVEDY